MKIYQNILELIGNTPLVELGALEKEYGLSARVVAKLEFFNPGFSVKSRTAYHMITQAEADGRLKKGDTILEGTSGNTGIGLAFVAAVKGYDTIIAMPDNVSLERKKAIEAYGGRVALTDGSLNMAGTAGKVEELAEANDHIFVPGQGCNPHNPESHQLTTGPEIWRDTDGKIDILVAASGTGGTITGTARYLKAQNPDIKIIAVEPTGNAVLNGGPVGPHKIQGIGGGPTPPVTDESLFDEVIDITDEEAYAFANFAIKKEGISVGISAGAAICAALQVAKRKENQNKLIVTIVPDAGERYLSSDLYDVT